MPTLIVLVIDDGVAVDRGVDDRDGAQRVDRCLDDEGEIGELHARALELGFLRLANLRDAREVHLEDRVHVRRRAPAEDHVLGDALPHRRHLLDVIGGAGLELRRRRNRRA